VNHHHIITIQYFPQNAAEKVRAMKRYYLHPNITVIPYSPLNSSLHYAVAYYHSTTNTINNFV